MTFKVKNDCEITNTLCRSTLKLHLLTKNLLGEEARKPGTRKLERYLRESRKHMWE